MGLLALGIVFAHSLPAESAPADTLKSIGKTETVKIYPSVIEATEWAGYEGVLSPDVSENALYQDFSESESAYVTPDEVVFSATLQKESSEPVNSPTIQNESRSEKTTNFGTTSINEGVANAEIGEADTNSTTSVPETEEADVTDVEIENASETEDTATPEAATEKDLQDLDESTPVETDSGSTTEEAETVTLKRATDSVFAFFSTVTKMLPLAQMSTTSPAEESAISPSEAATSPSSSSTVNETDTSGDSSATEEEIASSSATTTGKETVENNAVTATSSVTNSLVENDLNVSSSTESVLGEKNTETATSSSGVATKDPTVEMVEKTISLADFSMLPLEPGQFVKNMQLRASLAGSYSAAASGTIPTIEFVARTASGTQKLGSILLDGEVSNAINGGYFLFGFPQYEDVTVLSDVTIDVIYKGPLEGLDGAYLDALWLEVETETVTKEDLYKRSNGQALGHLKKPEAHEFVSEQKDFKRNETPVFNLRYVSQRNKAVEAVRNFLGIKKVKVEQIKVLHNGLSEIGIKPDVVVTKDGLVSISIPEKEQKKLKPGSYTVEMTLTEGGVTIRDSFDFQWGILAINTNKTEYQYGETATVSIGAITPAGNTLCNANLRLYVVDPRGGIALSDVVQSGKCNGNNVTDVPDYSSSVLLDDAGDYELYLERLDKNGEVIGHTGMNFSVVLNQEVSIERDGPTRIFPPAAYPMELTVTSDSGFSGTLTERVPNTFAVSASGAEVEDVDGMLELTWEMDLLAGQSKTVSYRFDAPDLSPYLYELGPAELTAQRGNNQKKQASSSESSAKTKTNKDFLEHRQWEIASDATGNMILFWDDGATIPTDWTCLSCGSGTFFQRFVMGSSTYNNTGGNATHSHTAIGSVLSTTDSFGESGSGSVAPIGHAHTYTPTISTESNLPSYRQLRVIQYTASAGEPATIPAGAIAIFDVASSSLPSGWTRYAAQDGRYIYGEDTPGTTGGSNTHGHSISGTTGNSSGAGTRNRGGGGSGPAASDVHTHTVSGSTASDNHEPPYVEVLLAELGSDAAPPTDMIAMWTEDVPSGWLDVSSAEDDPFSGKFIKPAATYGTTGGGETHVHADVSGIVSSGPSATQNPVRSGSAGASDVHTHNVDVTDFSNESVLPPYVTAVFGKRQGTDPVYEQLSYRWYVNEDAQTPTDPWPVGVSDLFEREGITATSTPVAVSEEVRLRMSVALTNATSTAGTDFKLQYAAGDSCELVGAWNDVGDAASSTLWRGYDNGGVTDSSTLASTTLASSTVAQTYEENGAATSTPNNIPVSGVGEWDFVLQQNDAAAGTNYCFRMVQSDGSAFSTYTSYPQLFTNEAPNAPSLETLFDNEKLASTTNLTFSFAASDAETDDVHYQIQIDDDFGFGSTLEDRDTISNASQFENQVNPADKTPFTSGDLMEFTADSTFTNGTTYYWRVRAQDPDGSDTWSDWSTVRSFTIDTSLTASAWFQTQDEQFDTNTLSGTETGADEVRLITGSSTGTMVSSPIDFNDGTSGTAWDSLVFNDTETTENLTYQIEYFTNGETWELIPDGALPGNSTGFDTSPVSLLGLEVETYDTIRVVANFSDVGGSPSLQDWEVQWGFRVETPTISKLFPSEKTSTTTPTFEFSTTDPQNDDLTYQISWSTDNTFAASTTRDSSVDAGYVNADTGADTDPFNSGDTVRFAVQGADALTNNETYWWRVRAKDTTGDNAWSFWTDPQSFTVDTTVTVSTWFQTSQEQFDSDILSGTLALANDSATVATSAVEAMIVYGQGTETSPRYRQWDGSSWGSEDTLNDIDAATRWAIVRAATTREEYVAATVGTDNDVNAQVFSEGAWGNLQEMTTSMGDTTARGFDVAYESTSGDALIVYCDGAANPSYRVWNGSTWSAEATITAASADDCRWIELDSDPNSDEIAMILRDADGSEYEPFIWNGSSWSSSATFGAAREATYSGISIRYEDTSGDALSAVPSPGGGPNRMVYNLWGGATWGGGTTQTIDGRLYWSNIARNVGNDDMVLCYSNDNSDNQAILWDGTADSWSGDFEFTATVNSDADPGFDCIYETTSGNENDILAVYSDTDSTDYRIYSGTWGAAAQVNSIGDAATMKLARTGDGTILGSFFDDVNDNLLFSSWDGTSWSTTETLESDMSVDSSPYGHPYWMAVRNANSEGTTIVTPGIDFTDGTGPYWESFSWNDSTPGSSDILYSMQYFDGTNWSFIPDSELPGNESGVTTGPVDLSGLNKTTYGLIRPYAVLSCDGSGNCPELQDWTVEWAEGITISGTAQGYDQTTNVTSGTVAVAVNGTLQTGKTGTIAAGAWSISNVTVLPGDVVTVFITGANDANEAVGVTTYDGIGDITGFQLYERHLALGSDDATSTALTNIGIGQYDFTNTEDIFVDVTGTTLDACATTGCADVNLFINASTTYNPQGTVITHDVDIDGTLFATTTLNVNGSWLNNGTSTISDATVFMTATSTTESIDTTGAVLPSFGNLSFGTTTGNATWTLANTLDVNGDLTVSRGTLARGGEAINLAGDLVTETNGLWSGVGTTTFDGTTAASWSDENASLQNVGNAVIDGSGKVVTLAGDVAAQSLTIEADDTLDASVSSYDLTTYGNFINKNSFVARNGSVIFAATTTGQIITSGGDAFYDVTFNGVSGAWSFTETELTVDNDVTIADGTVTMPTGTTTIAGSFSSAGGTFAHNNSLIEFTSAGVETITASGTAFTNSFYDLTFSGDGSWDMLDSIATSSNNVRVEGGTLIFPSTELAVGGSFEVTDGALTANTSTLTMYSNASANLTLGSAALYGFAINSSGTVTMTDTNATIADDLTVTAGTLVLPDGTLSLGGSLANTATIDPRTGEVLFNSSNSGETVDLGNSALYAMSFDNALGGWSVVTNATTTASTTIANGTFTLNSGNTLSVGGAFVNTLGGASTTWAGSTLSLENGNYSINSKTDAGDNYETLQVAATAEVSVWNSDFTSVNLTSGASLYSQDHAAVDGELYIYGDYVKNTGAEYWSYGTDFDGSPLTSTTSRQARVSLTGGSTVTLTNSLFEVLGDAAATTTVTNQGSGTYTVSVSAGTTTAQHYDFADLGATGLSLLSGNVMTSLSDGSFTVAAPAGSAVTLSSTTIDATPAAQIYNVNFATTTAIAATNVTQTDGVASSYWWFRESAGNLDGEAFDNDSGDPGTVRWDDSSLVVTIAGTVYSDAGSTPITGGTCDGSTNVVRVVVEGGATYDGSCSNADGSYSIGGVVVVGDPTITVFLNDAPGGEQGSIVTKTVTENITNADIYANRTILRHEDVTPITISDIAAYDSTNDSDLRFIAATTTAADSFTSFAQNEVFIWASSTFTPGGSMTLQADSSVNSYDGALYLGAGANLFGSGTTTYSIGGSWTQSAGATFTPASTTVRFTATTTGKTVSASGAEIIDFNAVQFTGAAGGWNLNGNLSLTSDLEVATGTVTGTGDVTLLNGSFFGDGLVSLGGGTTTIAKTNTLGGSQGWTFNDLTLGNAAVVGTTTPGSNATTTVGGVLTISTAHFLDAGSSNWNLTGAGDVLIENGTLQEDVSRFTYSGTNNMNVLATDYYNLALAAAGGSPTYTADGLGVQVFGDMTVGGAANTTVDFDVNDPALNIDGDLTIAAGSTFIASDSADFTVAANYDNNGTFTANNSTMILDGSGVHSIAAGDSDFAAVNILGTGSFTVTEHATATNFTISPNVSGFTLDAGQRLAVGGVFANQLGGAATTWTGSELYLFGGGDYTINPVTTSESYATLEIGSDTHIRSWNSDASAVTIPGTGSLYSMNHAAVSGDLYVYGNYIQDNETDHWSYTTDFDGTDLSGGLERQANVYINNGASLLYRADGVLSLLGQESASTTVQNQGSGVFAFTIGNGASTTMNYYDMQDLDADGLTFSGEPTVADISYGDFLVANNGDSAITTGGTAISANPALTFTNNQFATTTGVTTATNVTATGTSVSSWRFTNHSGDIDGEAFDTDPDGDPGYVVWDDSAASITIAGNVYSDEGTTASGVCDGATNNVHLRVAGLTTYTTSCNASTGAYAISSVTYSPGDALIVYIDGEAVSGAAVSEDPVSNINNLDVYENRVIVRHEGTDALSIADMAAWDSSDDADIPFTATIGTPDTLTLSSDTKLLIWTGKEFAPDGDVTLSNAGSVSFRGDLELLDGATYTAGAGEEVTIGGSLTSGSGASFSASTASTTFTAATAETISVNNDEFYNLRFTGSGSWSVTDATLSANDVVLTDGTLTLPTGTTTVSGSFDNNGGAFTNNGSVMIFDGSTADNTVRGDGSDFAEMQFIGSGSWTMSDINATSTGSVRIGDGTLTLPSGIFAVGGSFSNEGGAVVHNSSEIKLTSGTASELYANGSDLGGVTFAGAGPYSIIDASLTVTEDLTVSGGSVTFATGTMSIGGSFDATGGSFDSATGTILFNSPDTGETVNPGSNTFYNVVFGSATGGWTITGNATTTNNLSLTDANDFTLQSGIALHVGNVFDNSVGGSVTTWSGSTLTLGGGVSYEINAKSDSGDQYDTLIIAANADISTWSSAATTTIVADSSSLYSQDNAGVDGNLYIYGDYHIGTTTEYWSYATDFDGADLSGGSERTVTVSLANNATTSVDGGTLNIIGADGNETTITNQGSGTYGFVVSDGVLNAQYYALRNLNIDGLQLQDNATIIALNEGDFELAVAGGSLITLASTTLNANASLVITGVRFATTTAITGKNVTLHGTTSNAWTFVSHTGNLSGEAYDVDGASECGSIRWDDSSCLLTQQTHYRWRNDDGGVGVPNSQWYDLSWAKRKSVRIENSDATTYTDAVVKLSVDYDADMQPDFDDLRFTDSSGTTTIPFWIERSAASTDADVWVKIDSLPSNSDTTLYMYYDNTVATSNSSSTQVFVVADDFEDGDISEYSAVNDDKSLFTVDGSFAYGGDFGLDNTSSETARADDGGIYRTDVTVSQGEIIRYQQYVDTASGGDEVCTLFAVQSAGNNYAVCLEQVPGTDRISIAENVTDVDTSGTILSSSTVSYTTGWYEVEIDWQTNNDIEVTLSTGGSEVTTVSANDGTHTSGGIGFTYWFNEGGWDNYTSRPRVDTEPSVFFGGEQVSGGASWAAAQDTSATDYEVGETARLRLMVENSGLEVTGQTYQLEYAERGVAPSCEAVSGASYSAVPVQASCGSSPVCMQSSTQVTDGQAIADLLTEADGSFVTGEATEDPANTADALTIAQDAYTELEYVITPTTNVTDQNLCFRVSNAGSELDTYLRVAQLQLRFDPTLSAVSFNGGQNISLLPGTTTRVYATSTVTDLNGYTDIVLASSTMYTSAVGAACVADNNNCYITTEASQCSFTNCAGNSCVLECYADYLYHADPTDADGSNEWFAFLEAEDASGGYGFATSPSIDVSTLRALNVTNIIDYGALAPSSNTGSNNASTTIENEGNDAIDVQIVGDDLEDGLSSVIPANQQLFATSTFDYTTCTTCTTLATTSINFEVDLGKPTAESPPVTDDIYWGIEIPFGIAANPHTGNNTFYAIGD